MKCKQNEKVSSEKIGKNTTQKTSELYKFGEVRDENCMHEQESKEQ